jgi:hypothetical protein
MVGLSSTRAAAIRLDAADGSAGSAWREARGRPTLPPQLSNHTELRAAAAWRVYDPLLVYENFPRRFGSGESTWATR